MQNYSYLPKLFQFRDIGYSTRTKLLILIGGFAGRNLSMLPVEPKLGKMLILGAIFNCLDPIMTVVAGLSLRDPFLMPFDKKDVSLIA